MVTRKFINGFRDINVVVNYTLKGGKDIEVKGKVLEVKETKLILSDFERKQTTINIDDITKFRRLK